MDKTLIAILLPSFLAVQVLGEFVTWRDLQGYGSYGYRFQAIEGCLELGFYAAFFSRFKAHHDKKSASSFAAEPLEFREAFFFKSIGAKQ